MNFGYYNIDMETAPSTRLGIIGGMGSMAGVLLAQKIIRNSPACQDQDHIEFILHNNPLVPDRTKAILKGEQSPIDQLARSVEILDQQNVDLIVMACMTSYYFQEHVMSLSKAQLIRPIEITERHIAKIYPGAQRIGLLASTGTVKSRLFHDQLAASGKEVITLSDYEQENWLMKAIYQKNGLKSGQVSGDSRLLLDRCIESLREKYVDVIIGGCSEVPIENFTKQISLPYLDVMDITAKQIVELCYHSVPLHNMTN